MPNGLIRAFAPRAVLPRAIACYDGAVGASIWCDGRRSLQTLTRYIAATDVATAVEVSRRGLHEVVMPTIRRWHLPPR